MTIRPLQKVDFPDVIQLYKNCFPKTLMAIIGPQVIQKFLEWCLQKNHYFFVAYIKNQPVGFVSGYYYMKGEPFIHSTSELALFLRKDLINSLLKQPWKVFHPTVVKKILKHVKHQNSNVVGENDIAVSSELSILSIGVSPNFQRQGIAEKLTQFVTSFALEKSITHLKLTVETNNKAGLNFYSKNGWSNLLITKDYIVKHKYLTNE